MLGMREVCYLLILAAQLFVLNNKKIIVILVMRACEAFYKNIIKY